MIHLALGASVAGYQFGLNRIIIGLFNGLTYGLLAVGLVLVYRSSKFINFAHGSIGVFGAAVLGEVVTNHGVPYWLAFPAAIAVSALVGGVTEAGVVRRLAGRPRLIGMIATLGLSSFLLVFALVVNSKAATGYQFPVPPFLPTFHVDGTPIGPSYVAILILSPVLFVVLGLFLKRSRYGLAIRAAADDPDAASLEGIVSSRMATVSWAIAGGIAAFSAILVTPTEGAESLGTLGPDLLIKGLAGAVIARMQSIPVAVGVSLAVGVGEQVLLSKSANFGLVELVIGIVILLALLIQPRLIRRDDGAGLWPRSNVVTSWRSAAEEAAARYLRAGSLIVIVIAGIATAYLSTNDVAAQLTNVIGYALVALSVVIITGVAGQLSLGQFAVAGIGAAASIHAASGGHHFLLGPLAGCAAAALTGVILGIPSLRVRGLALAVVTLAFSLIVADYLLTEPWLLGANGVVPVVPRVGGYSFVLAKDYYLFALAMLVVGLLITANARRGGFGRSLLALRDNDDAARALGVSARKRSLQAYALAGVLAGLGGAVIAHSQALVASSSFPAEASIDVVAIAVVGGLGSLTGVLLGAVYIIGLPSLLNLGIIGQSAVTLGWLVAVVALPEGLGGPLNHLWVLASRALAPHLPGSTPLNETAPPLADLSAEPAVGAAEALLEPTISAGRLPTPLLSRPQLSVGSQLLSVRGLRKAYGGTLAVDDVSLDVAVGETVGIIGPNGAGKTTLFELIAGFAPPDEGRIRFAGLDITRASAERRARLGMVRSFQAATLFPTMTALETVMVAVDRSIPAYLAADLLGGGKDEGLRRDRAAGFLDLLDVGQLADQPIGELSTGQRRFVELAAALSLEPTLLLLDEPSAGIAHSEVAGLTNVFRRIHQEFGVTLVIIEHDLALLAELAGRMIAMELGQVIADDSPDRVRAHPRVVRSYLGDDPSIGARSGTITEPIASPTSTPLGVS